MTKHIAKPGNKLLIKWSRVCHRFAICEMLMREFSVRFNVRQCELLTKLFSRMYNIKMNTLRTINGRYFPSFFTIHADTCIAPEEYLKDGLVETIMHEYIHFIQDVSTVYGLANLSNTFSDISNFYNIIEDKIKLPYKFPNIKVREINKDLFSIYYSECPYFTLPKLDVNIEINSLPVSKLGLDGFPMLNYYEVDFIEGGNKHSFPFGACSLLEGMAKLIEYHLFQVSQNENKWVLPYDFPEIIAKHLYPKLGNNLAYVVALCDVSLMYYHSGEVFVKMLEMMKEENYYPQKIDDLYIFVISHLQIPGTNFKSFWTCSVSNAIKDIKNIVNVDEYNIAGQWAVNMIDYYYQLRISRFAFLSSIMELSPLEARTRLYSVFKDITSPVIYNNSMNFAIIGGYDIDKESHGKLIYWYNLSIFYYYLFYNEKTRCPFDSFCGIVDNCTVQETPWQRKGDDYCFYQQYSRMFALYKRQIIIY